MCGSLVKSIDFLRTLYKPKIKSMKKEDLEKLVKDLMEMNKYLIKENEELKKEVKRGKER